MGKVLDEMNAILNGELDEKELMHYGMPRRSGRYPYGSGENPYQHSNDFLSRIKELKKKGWTETPENIYNEFELTTTQYRAQKSIANNEIRLYDVARAKSLKKDGLGATEIGRIMGKSESTIRSLLNEESEQRSNKAKQTVDFLKKQINEKGMLDVGVGVERELNISKEKLNQALSMLEAEGYPIYKGGIPQATNPGKQTNQKVLCAPGTEYKEIYDYDKVKSVKEYISRDGGQTYEKKFNYPASLDSKRLKILLRDEVGPDGQTGIQKDGLIQIRRGVPDLDLGDSRYAQVRIMVDNKKYLKGMAVYSDDLPDGIDVMFNTNKTDASKALKDIKNDKDNPFGSLIKDADQGGQYWYDSKTGQKWDPANPVGEKKLGLINKRADEGDWSDWSDTLPSQFLSKQTKALAKKQLSLARINKEEEFEEIKSLTNPTIKKHLLEKFADECDSDAVNLKAAALPGQKYNVIIPINTLKDDEIYAPGYENGTKLALVRYPHGGTFEIPICTVNNKQQDAKKILGTDAVDAVGINAKVAGRLSGADFDGDTVMCIPTHDKQGKVKITSRDPLPGLEDFEPKDAYPKRTGMKFMKDPITGSDNTQNEMGKISNLITDMTLAGAPDNELAAAVRHSMVVIDAAKHELDYKKSEIDNNIDALRKKYQVKVDKNGNITYGGASTLISRASGEATIEKRQGSYKVNKKGTADYDPTKPEGAKIWKPADDRYYPVRKYDKTTGLITVRTEDGRKITYNNKDPKEYKKYNPTKQIDPLSGETYFTTPDGKIRYKTKIATQASTNMEETDDAYTLVSPKRHQMEIIYADYANSMKALGNRARMEMMDTGRIKFNKEAKEKYKEEVKSLDEKLNVALLNAPKERAAQRITNSIVAEKIKNDPNLSNKDIKKLKQQAITEAREQVGATSRRSRNIPITDKEWEAIQSGAIAESKLIDILNNTDVDALRQRAMPRQSKSLSTAQINRIKALSASNFTLDEIASKMGVSPSTIWQYTKGANK